jgi:hypothetical protein
MIERTKKLRKLMAAHKLSAKDTGAILNRSASTVRIWRCKDTQRPIPDHALALLESKLAERAGVGND